MTTCGKPIFIIIIIIIVRESRNKAKRKIVYNRKKWEKKKSDENGSDVFLGASVLNKPNWLARLRWWWFGRGFNVYVYMYIELLGYATSHFQLGKLFMSRFPYFMPDWHQPPITREWGEKKIAYATSNDYRDETKRNLLNPRNFIQYTGTPVAIIP